MSAQPGTLWCRKCFGFFHPNDAGDCGECPAGGAHDGTGSAAYWMLTSPPQGSPPAAGDRPACDCGHPYDHHAAGGKFCMACACDRYHAQRSPPVAATPDPLVRLLALAQKVEMAARQLADAADGMAKKAEELRQTKDDYPVEATHKLGGEMGGAGYALGSLADDLKSAAWAATEGLEAKKGG